MLRGWFDGRLRLGGAFGATVVVIVLVGGSRPTLSAAAVTDPNLSALLLADGRRVHATAGSYLKTTLLPGGGGMSVASDSAYPLPLRGRLPVHPRDTVTVLTATKALSVYVRIERRLSGPVVVAIHARPKADALHWTFRLPARLGHGPTRVILDVRYADGETNFEAGVRVTARPKHRTC
jgi:hypothetical protein